MAKLNTASRNALADRVFGIPKKRAYPMPDKSHAANAKARATQQVKKGNLSTASAAQIRRKANRVLGLLMRSHIFTGIWECWLPDYDGWSAAHPAGITPKINFKRKALAWPAGLAQLAQGK